MIAVEHVPNLTGLMGELYIFPQTLTQAINDRTQGLITDGFDRIVAAHWFDQDRALLLDAVVSKATRRPQGIRIHSVRPALAIWIRSQMPAGRLSPESSVYEILSIAAESFGAMVSCHPKFAPRYLYAGPWDGKQGFTLATKEPRGTYCTVGTFNKNTRSCELVWALNVSRYITWFRGSMKQAVRDAMAMSPTYLMVAQQAILETLLGAEWFQDERRRRDHPAYQRWCLCRDLAQREGRVSLSDLSTVHGALEILLDGHALIQGTSGDRQRLVLGELANYGDELVVKRIRAETGDKRKFGDILVEMSCAAFHRSKGHDVVATQDKGRPDLKITIPGWLTPVFADCKRLSVEPSEKWARRLVEKANEQLKRAPEKGYGIVYLDVSMLTDAYESVGEAMPKQITALEIVLQRLLQRHYRSVGAVVLLWKERMTLRGTGKRLGAMCVLRSRCRSIRHIGPLRPLPDDMNPLAVGFTVQIDVSRTNDKGAA